MEPSIAATRDRSRYVTRDPEYYEGEPMIEGTKVLVRDIVKSWKTGIAPESISADLFQLISTAQVFDALSFYLDHQDEIDAQIQVYIDRPFLDVPLSIRSYAYLDELDATIEAYRAEKNAEPWPMNEERERQLGEVA